MAEAQARLEGLSMVDVVEALSKAWGDELPDGKKAWDDRHPFSPLPSGALRKAMRGGELWPEPSKNGGLGELYADAARSVGVVDRTVRNWEAGRSTPRKAEAQGLFDFMVRRHMEQCGVHYRDERQAADVVAHVLCETYDRPRERAREFAGMAARALLADAETYLFDVELIDSAVAISTVSAALADRVASVTPDRSAGVCAEAYADMAGALAKAVAALMRNDPRELKASADSLSLVLERYEKARAVRDADKIARG